MKKFIVILLLLLNSTIMIGCNLSDAKYINFSKKPNNHYYTDQLTKKILSNEEFSLYVFDKNLYKEIQVNENEEIIIDNFLNSLITENYLDTSDSISDREPFRIKVVFKDTIFLLKIFSSNLVTLSPWDGNYTEDIISMENLPIGYNLFDFCVHVESKPIEK
ncbi:hypothetical protein FDA33_12675 [Clostridium botulinum]|uniref:DUF4883 family protein n=1 Tax=Clostridium botulinum TaxID=1491 RepID=UPI000596C959|nr:DUF4883 family protein [Clostridium botulinum]KIL07648.1 hypothetical protein SR42_00960 [Clostridium botulinum]MBY6934036.1 DUF4883 family protein [Clostridium botulinum]NFF82282.1 hypothetical protein [Clostridium botulinum]NFH80119.1 hypothetical protein [Clostridium botulinum]NFH81988.1 hypothetical protein [Clostridium botulinum]